MYKKIKKLETKPVDGENLKKTACVRADDDIHTFLATQDRGDDRVILKNSCPKQKAKPILDKKPPNDTKAVTNLLEKLIKKTSYEKDRGDLAKKQVKVAIISKDEESEEKVIIQQKDDKKITETEESAQIKPTTDGYVRKIEEETKSKVLPPTKAKNYKPEVQNKAQLDLKEKKRLRDKYTFRLKNNPNYNKNLNDNENKGIDKTDDETNKNPAEDSTDISKPSVSVKESGTPPKPAKDCGTPPKPANDCGTPPKPAKDCGTQPKPAKDCGTPPKPAKDCGTPPKPAKKQKEPILTRRPIIKTTRFNNRVYKAVTFVDQKSSPAPLQIKIPHDQKSPLGTEASSTKCKSTYSKVSVRLKSKKKTGQRKKKPLESPVMTVGNVSPPTEVAKWAPSSITRHTKPYYEAWVDTTLAAVNKCSKNDKMYLEKQKILMSFKKALNDRAVSPDLVYDKINDERYMGRIVIKRSKR